MLLQRLRKYAAKPGPLDNYLVGPHKDSVIKEKRVQSAKASKYLALHLRFEIDMVAHSLCEFGGGEQERQELEVFREIHFPALTLLKKTAKYVYMSLLHCHFASVSIWLSFFIWSFIVICNIIACIHKKTLFMCP